MSNTAILERGPRQSYTSLKDRFITPEEQAHKQNIADNFRKLKFDTAEAYNSAKAGDPAPVSAPTAPVEEKAPSAAARIAQYTPIATPAGSRELFSEYTYKDGTLYAPAQEEAVYTAAPVAPAQEEAVYTAAPVAPAADEEDAVPTRRTMDTLFRPAAKEATEEATKAGLFSALSTKTKVIFAAVCAVIVLALVLIGVNSGIIRSINSDILMKQGELEALTRATQSVQEQIADLTSPESIAEWAAKNNMVLGQ